ncbi:MAG TPA: VOC family protein [Thermoanaerobaculia bacterium]|nr:VOC family protein [Thermoanaerobaculia bacterium]
MLGDKDASVMIAVKNQAVAQKFYEGTLGLKKGDAEPGGLTLKSGSTRVFIYESKFAGTNQASAAAWVVDDVDEVVKALKAKGVSFERYDDLPQMKREGDIHVAGDLRAAWFKDPDGNILALSNR